jgi:soluble lytic murein transglycosylase-like protein
MRVILKGVIFGIITLFWVTPHKEPIIVNKCKQDPVLCQVIRNNPNIDKFYAIRLSKAIIKAHKAYKIDPKLLSAILMQESSYKLDVVSKTKDYSIGQINKKTIDHYHFNKDRLLIDLDYSVNCTTRILKDLKTKYKESDYWTRYHSFKSEFRNRYKNSVKRFM